MENASKALLIAGSVLIVILLIAMGVKVFNSTQGTTDSVETTMNATEVATFNNKWVQYVGKNKSKSQAISLLNQVIVNNSTISNHPIYITLWKDVDIGNAYTCDVTNIKNIINGTEHASDFADKNVFTIAIAEYDVQGYIKYIKIY